MKEVSHHVTLLWLNDWLIFKCSTFSKKARNVCSIIDGTVPKWHVDERSTPMHGNKTHNDHGEACVYHAVRFCRILDINI